MVGLEEFIARVFQGGKVTIPKRLREVLGVEDGDYVRLALVGVVKRSRVTGSKGGLKGDCEGLGYERD